MKFPIDKTMFKILNEAEEEFKDRGISREQIKEAFLLHWFHTKEVLKTNKFPTITFPKFGRFKPKLPIVAKAGAKFAREGASQEEIKDFKRTIHRISREYSKRKNNNDKQH